MMKKMNVMALVMALVVVFCMLCSCGTGDAESKDVLRDGVKKVYHIDEEGEKLVTTMFETFDNELKKIKTLENISEDDLAQYADNVGTAFNSFSDSFYKKFEPDLNGYEGAQKDDAQEIVLKYASLLLSSSDVTWAVLDYRHGNGGSGEICFESAVNFVNSCSEFFYGTDRITDEELDQLAEAFE